MVEKLEAMKLKGVEGKTGKTLLDAIISGAESSVATPIKLAMCDCVSTPCNLCILGGPYRAKAKYGEARQYQL